jgi:dTDP-4-amino-4,6-dideoxygalactose transaminase
MIRAPGSAPLRASRPTARVPALLGGEPAFAEPLYVTRPALPPRADLDRQLDRIYASGWLTNSGPLVPELERRLGERLGVTWCAAFCNGTVALQTALRALDLRGEVITTPFTFPATVHAIEWNGLTPVFCDVDPHTFNLDPDRAAELCGPDTCALLPVHVFGNPCAVDALAALAGARGLKIVYDAAHAFAVTHRGRPIGAFGDLSVFSFHATKLFHTAEGGAVAGADASLRRRIALLRNFGIVGEDEVSGVGTNGKMSELHAALGLALLERLDGELRGRARAHALYAERLAGVDGISLQRLAADTTPNHAYLAVQVDAGAFGLGRDQLHAALRAENVVTRKYFWPLCSQNEAYRRLPSARPERLPVATRIAARVLCLPLFGDLSADDVERVCASLLAIRAAAPAVARALGG